MLEAEVRQYHRGTAARPVVVAQGGLPDISCLVSCRRWEPRAAVLLLAHATYSNVQGMLTLVGEKELFLGLGMAGGYSTVVVKNGASTLHKLLQHAASSMEMNLSRAEGQFQKIGDLRRSQGVGLGQQNYGAVLIGQEIQTSLHACVCCPDQHGSDCRRHTGNRTNESV